MVLKVLLGGDVTRIIGSGFFFFISEHVVLKKKIKFMCMKYLTMGVCIGYCAKGWWVVGKVL